MDRRHQAQAKRAIWANWMRDESRATRRARRNYAAESRPLDLVDRLDDQRQVDGEGAAAVAPEVAQPEAVAVAGSGRRPAPRRPPRKRRPARSARPGSASTSRGRCSSSAQQRRPREPHAPSSAPSRQTAQTRRRRRRGRHGTRSSPLVSDKAHLPTGSRRAAGERPRSGGAKWVPRAIALERAARCDCGSDGHRKTSAAATRRPQFLLRALSRTRPTIKAVPGAFRADPAGTAFVATWSGGTSMSHATTVATPPSRGARPTVRPSSSRASS